MTVNLSQFIGPKGQAGYLGINAVQRALDFGLSSVEIKALANEQNLAFGMKAQAKVSEG